MKIVILDGFTANPGDLDWKVFESFGSLKVYDRTPKNLIVERCVDAEIVFTNKTPLYAETLKELPKLRFIGVLATGFNVVDINEARKLCITVCNVPAYSTMSVAQNVFALILDVTNNVAHYTEEVKNGKWTECEDFSFTDTHLTELSGKQLGIIGFGAIGERVSKIGIAFGMKTAAFTSRPQNDISPVEKMDLDQLFATSDIISLHCPLNDKTFHIVNRERLSLMKKKAVLINTGRGPLVDEEALAQALKEGKIAAAGIDVMAEEPPCKSNPLLSAPNIRITPHISWATEEARRRLLEISEENLRAFLAGHPQNVVS